MVCVYGKNRYLCKVEKDRAALCDVYMTGVDQGENRPRHLIRYVLGMKQSIKYEPTSMAPWRVSPSSSKFATNSCVTGNLEGISVQRLIVSGLQPFK